jgi:hypothetical protein
MTLYAISDATARAHACQHLHQRPTALPTKTTPSTSSARLQLPVFYCMACIYTQLCDELPCTAMPCLHVKPTGNATTPQHTLHEAQWLQVPGRTWGTNMLQLHYPSSNHSCTAVAAAHCVCCCCDWAFQAAASVIVHPQLQDDKQQKAHRC